MLALKHLQFDVDLDASDFLNRGIDVVVDYFCGDWWNADKESQQQMDKSRKNPHRDWFGAFSEGLLLLLLSKRWDDVERVCAWVDADLPPYPIGVDEDLEDEVIYLHQSIAASLRPEPMPGVDELESAMSRCRKKRTKLLYKAWDAARNGDQNTFDAAMGQSVEEFVGRTRETNAPLDYVAHYQSTVSLAAQRLGMTPPKLPPKLQARMMTRESTGLA